MMMIILTTPEPVPSFSSAMSLSCVYNVVYIVLLKIAWMSLEKMLQYTAVLFILLTFI